MFQPKGRHDAHCCRILYSIVFAALCLATPSFGQFMYVVGNGGAAYALDTSTGALTLLPGSPFGISGQSVTIDPTGSFAYVTGYSPGIISAFTINANSGALKPVAGSPFSTVTTPDSAAVDPTGKFLYVAYFRFFGVSGYTINAETGALTTIPGSPFAGPGSATSIAVDPTGRFVYVANGNGGCCASPELVSAYSINPVTGGLTAIPGSPFLNHGEPVAIVVHPSGKFAYVANFGNANVSAYMINPTTGALVSIHGSPFATGNNPSGLAMDPSGQFLFVGCQAQDSESGKGVSVFTVSQTTGALTEIPGSIFPAGPFPDQVAVDPTGKFIYVGNFLDSTIYGFAINTLTGALGGAVPGSPFDFASSPASIAITPSVKSPDTTPPFTDLYSSLPGPPKQVQLASIDRQSGLAAIQVLKCDNCTAVTDSFTPGTRALVLTTATKADQTKGSAVKVQVTDVAGNSAIFDPVDISIQADGRLEQQEVRISPIEHIVQITNGNPGVGILVLEVNGVKIPVIHLKDGEAKVLDIGHALHLDRANLIGVTSLGRQGATASIVFTEP